MTSIDEHARDVVSVQPTPPRRVSLWPVVFRSYASRSGRIVTPAGLFLGVPAIVAGLIASGSVVERVIFLAVAIGVAMAIGGAAGVRGWRVRRALAIGQVVDGEVIRAAWFGPSIRPATVDAQVQGMARGTWRIIHPQGPFEASFESDAPWAARLRKGTAVRVLVDPNQPRVLLDLGPIDA